MTYKHPKLSIIVPAYNAESTITQCIDSLITQTLKDIEIILIDDNSTDGTLSIMNFYKEKYSHKIIVLQSNKSRDKSGPGYARNLGIQLATGKYIGFVDSDDWVDCTLFDTVYNEAEKAKADIAIFGVKDESDNIVSSNIRYQYQYFNELNHTYALRLLCRSHNNNIFISPMVCQKIFNATFIRKYNLCFDTDSLFEDDQFMFCSFLHECKIILVPDVFYHYYQNPNSITHSFSKKYIDDLVKAFVNIKNYCIQQSCYEEFDREFHAFFEKGICSTLKMVFSTEPLIKIQKEYITYLIKKLSEEFTVDEWIDYLDLERIRRFFIIQ